MNEKEQIIALAEFGGCKLSEEPYDYMGESGMVTQAYKRDNDQQWIRTASPNHLADLNADRELEDRLTPAQQIDYVANLWKVTNPKPEIEAYNWNQTHLSQAIWWSLAHASASQRCEAILRTIGKWKD